MRQMMFAVVGLLATTFAWSQAPVEGRDFTRIVPAHSTADPNRIVVTEFFSYKCPHCFAFSAPFKRWSSTLPNDVVCRREAVAIGHAAWEPSARTFYVLQSMQKLADLDDAFFAAVHREGVPLATEDQIAGWLAKRGIAKDQFAFAYRSFSVETQFTRGYQLARAARLPSVPTITIDGKYLVAVASNISFEKQLAVVDALIARVRAERGQN